MGNWTTVNMVGKCAPEDVKNIKGFINYDDDWEKFNCLSNTGGLCGLNDWADEKISVIGNLAEQDYSTDDIKEALDEIVKLAPSLELKVHVGGDYESLDCIATVEAKEGVVEVKGPEIEKLMEIPSAQINGNLLSTLMLAK